MELPKLCVLQCYGTWRSNSHVDGRGSEVCEHDTVSAYTRVFHTPQGLVSFIVAANAQRRTLTITQVKVR